MKLMTSAFKERQADSGICPEMEQWFVIKKSIKVKPEDSVQGMDQVSTLPRNRLIVLKMLNHYQYEFSSLLNKDINITRC